MASREAITPCWHHSGMATLGDAPSPPRGGRCDRGGRTSHQGCYLPWNCFSCKEQSLSISGPKRTKYLQAFLEMYQAFLSTMPSLRWDLKKTTANQSVKFIDAECLRLATGWILSRTIPHGGESKPQEREEGKRDSRKISLQQYIHLDNNGAAYNCVVTARSANNISLSRR